MFDRLNLLMLRVDEAVGSLEERRARVKRMRLQAVVLFLLLPVLGVLRYRSTDSKRAWVLFVGLLLSLVAGRIYYANRLLAAMDEATESVG